MSAPFQLPGFRSSGSAPRGPVGLVVAAGVAVILVLLLIGYIVRVWPLTSPSAATADATAGTPTVPPHPVSTLILDADDLHRHIERAQLGMLRSLQDLERADREWSRVMGRLDAAQMPDTRRRVVEGIAATRDARTQLDAAVHELQIISEHIR